MNYKTPTLFYEKIALKAEFLQIGGSHKTRAAERVLNAAIQKHPELLTGEKVIIEKTGGNFGLGLASAAQVKGVKIELVIGNSFSKFKKSLCITNGAKLVGENLLNLGKTPKEVIDIIVDQYPNRYVYTDQFANKENLMAHVSETAPEIFMQTKKWVDGNPVIFVGGAGTGASFQAIRSLLSKKFPEIRFVLVAPEGNSYVSGTFTDHIAEGIAVGVKPPFLTSLNELEEFQVSEEEIRFGQNMLVKDFGVYCGPTSGANYFAALQLSNENKDARIITLAYDLGDSYLATNLLKQRD